MLKSLIIPINKRIFYIIDVCYTSLVLKFHALYAPFHLINIELVPILMGH